MSEVRICTACGYYLAPGTKFCAQCGNRVEARTEPVNANALQQSFRPTPNSLGPFRQKLQPWLVTFVVLVLTSTIFISFFGQPATEPISNNISDTSRSAESAIQDKKRDARRSAESSMNSGSLIPPEKARVRLGSEDALVSQSELGAPTILGRTQKDASEFYGAVLIPHLTHDRVRAVMDEMRAQNRIFDVPRGTEGRVVELAGAGNSIMPGTETSIARILAKVELDFTTENGLKEGWIPIAALELLATPDAHRGDSSRETGTLCAGGLTIGFLVNTEQDLDLITGASIFSHGDSQSVRNQTTQLLGSGRAFTVDCQSQAEIEKRSGNKIQVSIRSGELAGSRGWTLAQFFERQK